jgi:hypothetical protein
VLSEADAHPELHGMGATLTMAYVQVVLPVQGNWPVLKAVNLATLGHLRPSSGKLRALFSPRFAILTLIGHSPVHVAAKTPFQMEKDEIWSSPNTHGLCRTD